MTVGSVLPLGVLAVVQLCNNLALHSFIFISPGDMTMTGGYVFPLA